MITLPDTLQEVFDIVSKHLLAQGKASVDHNSDKTTPFCMYRNPDGLKCAAGALIPDDKYNTIYEGCGWHGLVNREIIQDKFKEEIGELQQIHDLAAKQEKDIPTFWKNQLANFAKNHKLQFNTEV